MPSTAPGASERVVFLDGLRGLAIILMVVNHTARWWMDRSMGWPRSHLVYLTVPLAAPLFPFLAGFSLPLAFLAATRDRGESFTMVAWRNVRRAVRLILGGWLLTLLVFPEVPLFRGDVLQMIGVSLIGLLPILPLLRWPLARVLAVLGAIGWYASFHWAHPSLPGWLEGHPVISEVWFTGFAPWPWFAFPLLGAALGWIWAERHRRGADVRIYFGGMLAAGLACLGAFLPLELWLGNAPWHFSNSRDIAINKYLNPGAVTCLFILGYIFSVLPLAHYMMEVRRCRPGWLLALGRHSLMLYFVHHVIALTLLHQRLGLLIHSWWLFALANVALVALLVGLAQLWPAVKQRVRAWWTGLRRPAPAARP